MRTLSIQVGPGRFLPSGAEGTARSSRGRRPPSRPKSEEVRPETLEVRSPLSSDREGDGCLIGTRWIVTAIGRFSRDESVGIRYQGSFRAALPLR